MVENLPPKGLSLWDTFVKKYKNNEISKDTAIQKIVQANPDVSANDLQRFLKKTPLSRRRQKLLEIKRRAEEKEEPSKMEKWKHTPEKYRTEAMKTKIFEEGDFVDEEWGHGIEGIEKKDERGLRVRYYTIDDINIHLTPMDLNRKLNELKRHTQKLYPIFSRKVGSLEGDFLLGQIEYHIKFSESHRDAHGNITDEVVVRTNFETQLTDLKREVKDKLRAIKRLILANRGKGLSGVVEEGFVYKIRLVLET